MAHAEIDVLKNFQVAMEIAPFRGGYNLQVRPDISDSCSYATECQNCLPTGEVLKLTLRCNSADESPCGLGVMHHKQNDVKGRATS